MLLLFSGASNVLHSDSANRVVRCFVTAFHAADNAYIPVGQFAWVNEGWIGVQPKSARWLAPSCAQAPARRSRHRLPAHAHSTDVQMQRSQGVRLMPGDRAALAHSAGKPLLLEEYGAQRQYITPRDALIHRCSLWTP